MKYKVYRHQYFDTFYEHTQKIDEFETLEQAKEFVRKQPQNATNRYKVSYSYEIKE